MGINVKVKPALKLLARLKVLHGVMDELARGLGAPLDELERIRKGILEQQLLDRVWFYYLDSNGKAVCQVTLAVDWEAHLISASSDDGKALAVDSELSIAEQISAVFPVLIEHVREICDLYYVTRIVFFYRYRQSIYNDPQKLSEARRLLNLGSGQQPPRISADPKDPAFLRFSEKYSSARLKELGIQIRHS
jgi:hypothetical protein